MDKNQKPVPNRHDRFFRAVNQMVREAKAFLQGVLSKEEQVYIQWDTLKRDTESYITPELKEYMSDLVYWAQWSNGKQGGVAFLFEHKSGPQTFPIRLQLETYLNKLRLAHYREGKPLELVVPILFYHGGANLNLGPYADLFDADLPNALRGYLPPDQKILVLDLNEFTDKELLAMFPRDTIGRFCVLMKHIHDADFPEKAHEYLGDLREWEDDPERRDLIRLFLLYVKSEYVKRNISMEKLTETVKQTGLDYEDPMRIFALDYIEEAKEEERARLEGLLAQERARADELLAQERARAEQERARTEQERARTEQKLAHAEQKLTLAEQERYNERVAHARAMKGKGYPEQDIAEITGLSPAEIQHL